MNDNVCKIGDHIIDHERIYVIFEVKDGVVYFKPIGNENSTKEYSCSIPMPNLTKAGFRKVLTKSEAKKIMQGLSDVRVKPEIFDIKSAKETQYANDWVKNIALIESIQQGDEETGDAFSKAGREMADTVMSHMANEIAFVTGNSVKKVRQIISKALMKEKKKAD